MRMHRAAHAAAIGVAVTGTTAAHAAAATPPATLPARTFVAAPPSGSTGPDDLARLSSPGRDGGRPLIWTAYQNGINPDGTPGTPGGPAQSTVAGYDPASGALEQTIAVTGKVDGLAADDRTDRLVATVNEDANSALAVVDPRDGSVARYRYSPSPEVNGNGGTDAVAIWGGSIFVSHSNPANASQAAMFEVRLDAGAHIAHLTPVFRDDAMAWNVVTHRMVRLALTDPDTTLRIPNASSRDGNTLALVSQGDGEIVFAGDLRDRATLRLLPLRDDRPGNLPPVDGVAVATAEHGTLYAVDAAAGTITALDTSGWPEGTVFVTEADDSGNPQLGVLDLRTGVITRLGNAFTGPKGLLFVPAG